MVPTNGSRGSIVVGLIVAVGLGIAVFLAVPRLRETTSPPTRPVSTHVATVFASPTDTPAGDASPTVAVTPTPVFPVTMSLTSIERSTTEDGVIVAIDVANNGQQPLTYAFNPAQDVVVHDSLGASWSMRWAEYNGNPSFPAGASSQLIRALFAGDASNALAWPVTVDVHHVPGVSLAHWQVNQNDAMPQPAAQSAPASPPSTSDGSISLTASNPVSNSGEGGVQVDLEMNNGQSSDMTFAFDPNVQVIATDDLGRPYNVQWAQYDGTVRIPAQSSGHLATVFLSGPMNDGHPTWLRVIVRQVPGVGPISATVPL